MRIIKIIKRKLRVNKGLNLILNKETIPVSDNELEVSLNKRVVNIERKVEEFWAWLKASKLQEFQNYSFPHKKALEFFFSALLLEITNEDVVLDAAGGKSNYLLSLKRIFSPSRLILQDHIYDELKEENDMYIVGGDIAKIPLGSESLDKISCHHAFEHFQEDKDCLFIKEISRLLKPNGKAVIIPLFISNNYIESWNIEAKKLFDESAKLIIDNTSTLPGGDADGHFARIYNPAALQKRILSLSESINMEQSIFTCKINGKDIPDMNLNLGALINCPLRALVLRKRHFS